MVTGTTTEEAEIICLDFKWEHLILFRTDCFASELQKF